jgi:hypothetical protein
LWGVYQLVSFIFGLFFGSLLACFSLFWIGFLGLFSLFLFVLGYISWFWGFVLISCVLIFDAMRLLN